jgi:hypothetical protein
MNCFKTAIAASMLALTATSAFAAEFPKSGSTKATGYLTATITDQLDGWEAEWQPENYVMTGIIRNEKDGGPFDKSFLRCIGVEAMVAGAIWDNGTCTETDKDGDKIFITYVVGVFTFIGGTGKYKGITGGGPTTGDLIFQDKKNWAAVVSFEKNWEIK